MLPPLRINPSLNPDALGKLYAKNKFVQVRNVFEPEHAEAISHILRNQIRWKLIYQTPEEGVVELSKEQIDAMGSHGVKQRMDRVMELARRSHGFCYSGYHMIGAILDGSDPGHPIHEVTKFLNSPEFIDFGSRIIGETGITKVDAQATLFGPGSFLTRHVDKGSNNERRAAYTLGFSKNWHTDWGGLLMFIDKESTDVTEAFIPRFNMLTLFDGRKVHSVSPISSFAGDGRFSIVGWLRNDPVG